MLYWENESFFAFSFFFFDEGCHKAFFHSNHCNHQEKKRRSRQRRMYAFNYGIPPPPPPPMFRMPPPQRPQRRTLFEDPREDLLSVFLLQVFVTLILCKVLAKLLSFIHQPAVIGQILGGIILGPSALGFIPGFSAFLFSPHTLNSFQLVASLGLIFFMFYLGLKMDPNEIRHGWRRTLPLDRYGEHRHPCGYWMCNKLMVV